MRFQLGLPSRRAWPVAALVWLALAAGCSGEPAADEQAGEGTPALAENSAPESPADSAGPPLRRFLPDEMRRSTRAESFPHEAHGQIDCSVCHDVPNGHATHADVECAGCHRASASVTVRELRPEQCAACHHGAEQRLTCRDCHEDRPVVASVQMLDLEVWSAPRSRALTFDHDVHGALDCTSCHRAAPLLTPTEPCSTCHSEHHAEGVRCVSCHTPPPPTAHDVQAHLSCSGAGCHRAPEVEAITDSRSVCVVCHQAQEEHEPGGNCVECHRVRPETPRRLGP